jgi:hypothetical protein
MCHHEHQPYFLRFGQRVQPLHLGVFTGAPEQPPQSNALPTRALVSCGGITPMKVGYKKPCVPLPNA